MLLPRFPFCTWRFQVSGLNLERFIALLSKERIPLLGVQRTDVRTLECRCHASDMHAITALADAKGWRIHHAKPGGLSAGWYFLKTRPGIPIGLILAVLMLMTLSQFIWRVDIHGAGPYAADLSAYLAQNGLKPGARRSVIDAKLVEQQLNYRYPQLAWLHVYVSNVTLVVDVTKGIPMPELSSQDACDLIAAHDGVVETMRIFAGTAAVHPGDTVTKGQVLIRGEERGSDGGIVPVRAEGVVTARCWKSATVSVPLRDVTSRETGRETASSRICTPWFALPATPAQADYLASNIYMKEIPVAGCFFPVYLQLITQREVAMEYVYREPSAVRKEAAQAAFDQLKNALHGYEIIDKWVDYCMIEDESVSARVTAEWLMDIGGTDPP